MTSLVFLHGVGGNHHAWDDQLPFFAARGYGAHAWDQPGYGQSPVVEPYDWATLAAALVRLIDHLGDGPVVLVGHSMGGYVAQETYARHPERVRGLVLAFTTAAFGSSDSRFARDFVAQRLAPLDAGRSMAELAAALVPTLHAPGADAQAVAHAVRMMAQVPPETYRQAIALLTTFDRRELLSQIRVPTLLVAGSADRVAPPAVMRRIAERIPGAEYAEIEGCGHLGPMEQPMRFNEIVLAFLHRHQL